MEEACDHPSDFSVLSALELEGLKRVFKEFRVISLEPFVFDFVFLLISESLIAIYLRAYPAPSLFDAFED